MRRVYFWLTVIIFQSIILSSCTTPNTETSEITVISISTITPEPSQTPGLEEENPAEVLPSATQNPTETEIILLTYTPTPNLPTITSTPSATIVENLSIGSTRISEIDQMVQVYVPAGEFIMGSEDNEAIQTTETGRAYPEIPLHTVYLTDFWIDKFEVTNGQYALCVEAGVCQPPFIPTSFTRNSYYYDPEFSDYPVIYVDWPMARSYCEWAGRRLPTEAEWEKAARGTDGRKYPWGNEMNFSRRVNMCDINCPRDFANGAYDDGFSDTSPVGSFPDGASPYGAMDMAGNVWEWNGTLIQPYPYDPNDGREDFDTEGERSWRGAAFSNGYWWIRTSVRYRSVTYYRYYNLGFRCASTN